MTRASLMSILALAACNGPKGSELTGEAVATYADIVRASYEDSVQAASALDAAVDTLVATPSAANQEAAQSAWRASREPYLQTEVYRFYDGPIDNPVDGREDRINAWPLDENYIDYVDGDADAGIINDPSVTIDADAVASLNLVGGEKNVATGFHAVEFLLWGQDHSDTGPGDRPYTDYVTGEGATAANQDRRGTYVSMVSQLLVDDLTYVRDAWAEDATYRADFEADADASFGKILTGMIILSGHETGGERLQAAFDSGDQEDEHSCFSDNTHRDMVQDVVGIQNVWAGKYVGTADAVVDGTSIRDVVAEQDPELADELDARIQESLDLANALHTPFDQEIKPASAGRERVQALISSLHQQETILFEVFDAFGLSVEIPE